MSPTCGGMRLGAEGWPGRGKGGVHPCPRRSYGRSHPPETPKTDSLGVGDPSDRPNGDTIVSGTPDITPVVLPGSLPFAVPAALRALSSPRTPKLVPGRGYLAVQMFKLDFLENEASDRPGAKNKIDRVSI